jgi:hypothetical protein
METDFILKINKEEQIVSVLLASETTGSAVGRMQHSARLRVLWVIFYESRVTEKSTDKNEKPTTDTMLLQCKRRY